MKILLANVPAGEENSEAGQFIKTVVVDRWRRNLELVKQKDTEITFRFPRRGLTGLDAFMYSYLHHLSDGEIFHAVVQAEKEGFDAAMITCFHDPMLWDIRQAVDIPVVSIGESSMLLATMMGRKFGVVTISPYSIHDTEENIARYGLAERAVGVRSATEDGDQQPAALVDSCCGIEAFKEVAKELIADGAEVLIPGCGLMSPALRLAPGAEKEYPNGVTDVDGVPVADVLGDTIKMAEALVSLKQAGSSWISRTGLYAQATPRAREFGEMVLEYNGPGFWDC
jgi:Asp/Glu/hydantoin racemase